MRYVTGFACNKSGGGRTGFSTRRTFDKNLSVLTLCDFLVCLRETRIMGFEERINLSRTIPSIRKGFLPLSL